MLSKGKIVGQTTLLDIIIPLIQKSSKSKYSSCLKTRLWFFLQRHQDFYDSLFTVCSNSPRSLMHLCRCAIRAILSERCHREVPLLSIPLSMKKYLLLEPEGIIYWATAEQALASPFPDPYASVGCQRSRHNPDGDLCMCPFAGQPASWTGIYWLSSELLSCPTLRNHSCRLQFAWGRQSWKGPCSKHTQGTHCFVQPSLNNAAAASFSTYTTAC